MSFTKTYTSVFPRTAGAVPGEVAIWVMTANGSEVPLKAPATFLSLEAWREISSFILGLFRGMVPDDDRWSFLIRAGALTPELVFNCCVRNEFCRTDQHTDVYALIVTTRIARGISNL